MKYIRTKDGRIIDFDSLTEIAKASVSMDAMEKNCDFEIADTIEELCDEFVVVDGDQNATFRNLKVAKSTKGDLYGNIIVDGLSHSVAKMNKDGVFELL